MWLAVGRGGGENQTQIQTSSHSLFQPMLRSGLCKTTSKNYWMESTELFCFSSHSLLKWQTLRFKRSLGSYWPVHYHESRGAQTDPLGLSYGLPQDAVSQWMVLNVSGRATHAAVASLYLLKRQGFQAVHLSAYNISPDRNSLKQENRHTMCLLLIFSFKFLCYFWNGTRLELSFDGDEPNVTSYQRETSLSLVTGNTK